MIETKRTWIKILDEPEAGLLLDYYMTNSAHLMQWEPKRPADHFTLENFKKLAADAQRAMQAGTAFHYIAISKETKKVVGVCHFSGVTRGVFLACFLGYSIAKESEGKGLMKEILTPTIDYMFNSESLNRIIATYMPINKRSANVLASLGFEEEGRARKYLKINDRWEDHVLTAKINE